MCLCVCVAYVFKCVTVLCVSECVCDVLCVCVCVCKTGGQCDVRSAGDNLPHLSCESLEAFVVPGLSETWNHVHQQSERRRQTQNSAA